MDSYSILHEIVVTKSNIKFSGMTETLVLSLCIPKIKIDQHRVLFLGRLNRLIGIRIKDWYISIDVHSSVILRNHFLILRNQ